MRRIPPLNSLRAFEATARHLSFTRAADELCVTQGAVSRHVRNLEEYLGVLLIQRNTRHLNLTDAGVTMLSGLTQSFNTIANTVEAVTKQHNDLNLLVSSGFAMLWLIPRLHRFEEDSSHPHVRLTTRAGSISFEREYFDAGIIYGDGNWPGLQAELVFREQLIPVCSQALMKTEYPLTDLANLKHHTLLHPSTDHRDWRVWLQANEAEGVDPDQGLAFESMDAALRAASMGHGIAISDLSLIQDELASQWLLQPFPGSFYSGQGYYFVYPPEKADYPQIQRFQEWLGSELTDSHAGTDTPDDQPASGS